jgi:hypothetical protein
LNYEKLELEFDFAVADGGRLEAAQEFRDQSETFIVLAYLIELLGAVLARLNGNDAALRWSSQ